MTPAQRVIKMILENHKPIDIGADEGLKYVTGEPAVPVMTAYYPVKKSGLEQEGGMDGILSIAGTERNQPKPGGGF